MLRKLAALPLLAFIVLSTPLQVLAQPVPPQGGTQTPQGYYMPGPWHMWNDGYAYGSPFWWIGPLMMLLFFIVIFGAIIFLVRRGCGHGMHHWGPSHMMDRPWGDPSHSALQILNERFAKGEIQKDEYTEKKAALLSGTRQ